MALFCFSCNPKPEVGTIKFTLRTFQLAASYALEETHKELVSSKTKQIFKCGLYCSLIRDVAYEHPTLKYQVITPQIKQQFLDLTDTPHILRTE